METTQGIIGMGTMSQQQLNWLESKFKDFQSHRDPKLPYDFQRWNGWRIRHGFVCDTDAECTWISKDMECRLLPPNHVRTVYGCSVDVF